MKVKTGRNRNHTEIQRGDGRDGRKETGRPTAQEDVGVHQQSAVQVHVTGCM